MDNYLILEFRNAGLFKKHRNTKDKMFDMNIKKDRKDSDEFVEPITVHQISNMLHVLFGERPNPINRNVLYEKNQYLYNKALSSYLKIDSYKNEKGEFYKEKMQMKKSVRDSWSKQSYLYWERVKMLLEDKELIDVFINTLSEIFNCNIEDYSFEKVIKMIKETKNERIDNLFSLLKSKKKTPLYNLYHEIGSPIDINQNPRTQLTILTGLDEISKLRGKILVPISDDDVSKIKQNKGCATILDGGFVYIKGIRSGDSINVNGFIKVENISLEKR